MLKTQSPKIKLSRFIRRSLMAINYAIGRSTGYKLQRVTYSRPSTLFVKNQLKGSLRVIEIGCAAGHNASDILTKLDVLEFYAVDPYECASADYHDYPDSRLIWMRKQAETRLQKYQTKVNWIKQLSTEAVDNFSGEFDFVYVDGDHSYEAVLQDLRKYYGLVVQGGVIAGHDIDQPEVLRAFFEFISENNINRFYIKDPDWIIVKNT